MAINVVQCQYATVASASSIGVTITPTSGNAIIVIFIDGAVSLSSLGTLTVPSGYTTKASINSGGSYQEHAINYSVSGGSQTPTYSWTGGAIAAGLYALEISGMLNAGFDQTNSQTFVNSSTTIASGTTGTLAQAAEIAVASWNLDGSFHTTLVSLSNSYTAAPTNGDQTGNTTQPALLAYLITNSTAATSSTETTTDACSGTGLISTWEAAATVADTQEWMIGSPRKANYSFNIAY